MAVRKVRRNLETKHWSRRSARQTAATKFRSGEGAEDTAGGCQPRGAACSCTGRKCCRAWLRCAGTASLCSALPWRVEMSLLAGSELVQHRNLCSFLMEHLGSVRILVKKGWQPQHQPPGCRKLGWEPMVKGSTVWLLVRKPAEPGDPGRHRASKQRDPHLPERHSPAKIQRAGLENGEVF